MSLSEPDMAKTLIITVNYRTPGDVVQMLASLEAEIAATPGMSAVVVDNASGDGSVEQIRDRIDASGWAHWVSLLPLADNRGFAAGNNAAICRALANPDAPDFLLLLNPDTIVRPRSIASVLEFMHNHPEVGIAGGPLDDPAGRRQRSAHRFPTPLSELEAGARLGLVSRMLGRRAVSPPPRDEAHACDWVSGAFMMVRRDVFDSVGLLDEGYFLYFEEVDFCRRAKNAGWEVWHVPGPPVVHIGEASTGVGAARRMPAYWFDSRRRYFLKHHGPSGLLMADVLWAIGRATYALRRFLRLGRRFGSQPQRFTRDLLRGDCRAIICGQSRRTQELPCADVPTPEPGPSSLSAES